MRGALQLVQEARRDARVVEPARALAVAAERRDVAQRLDRRRRLTRYNFNTLTSIMSGDSARMASRAAETTRTPWVMLGGINSGLDVTPAGKLARSDA